MKKFVSILLCILLMLSLSVTAFATDTTTVTINDSVTTRTFYGYQLLTLTVSPKIGEHYTGTCLYHEDLDEFNEHSDAHSDTCYNYAYAIPDNSKYLNILKEETYGHADETVLGDANSRPASAGLVTVEQIKLYLSKQDSSSMLSVARRLYAAISAADPAINKDATPIRGRLKFISISLA